MILNYVTEGPQKATNGIIVGRDFSLPVRKLFMRLSFRLLIIVYARSMMLEMTIPRFEMTKPMLRNITLNLFKFNDGFN